MRKKYIILIFLCLWLNFQTKVDAFSYKREARHAVEGNESDYKTSSKPTTHDDSSAVEYEETTNEKPKRELLRKKCDPCPTGIVCVPQIQCPAHIRMQDHEKPQICDLPGEKFGYCCQTGQNHTATYSDIARFSSPTFLPVSVLESARRKFEHLMHDIATLPVRPGMPDFTHGIAFHSTPQDELHNFEQSNNAMEQVITNQEFTKNEHVPLDDIITNNIHVDLTKTSLADQCQPPPICRDLRNKYRNIDGSCNNPLPQRTMWGAAGQSMERLLPPAYEDGIWTPRAHSTNGAPLLSARDVSRHLLADIDRPHHKYNLLLMQFGQLIAHDVSQSSSVRLETGELVQCCTPSGKSTLPPSQTHFACLPIMVAPDDEFYGTFGVRCLNFVRLSLVPSADCKLGYGKQRSKVTHFLDASPVYGSSESTARELRTFRGGKLRMFNDFGRDLLPLTNDKKTCDTEEPGKTCFKSGDGRTNQIISLIALHIIFAREHNRIAGKLAQINRDASDTWLYQEARRIVIAELQHIAYNEYLPSVIGPMQLKRFRLVPQHHGYSHDYSVHVNPAITNEFSGAAFRMGHSSVDGKFHIQNEKLHVDEVIKIPDVMFNPSRMRKRNFLDDLLRTLYTQPMQKVDSSITSGLSRFLFHGHNPFGLDLAAINIQRGRDQGLRAYNDYLEVMGQSKLKSFDQLPQDIAAKLRRVYNSPDDIDLWIGGLLEAAADDGIVGNTFSEIIADQFSRFKHGDRYFYENDNEINPGAFTLGQLDEIRKITLARLICDNSDELQTVPIAAFVRADFPANQMIHCKDPHLPSINLELWRK